MSLSSPSGREVFAPSLEHPSRSCPGVVVRVKRMTLGGRIELLERLYPLLKEAESMAAGASQSDQARRQLCTLKIHEALLSWGVVEVKGLRVDGWEISAVEFSSAAPEVLVDEVLQVIEGQVALTTAERKN